MCLVYIMTRRRLISNVSFQIVVGQEELDSNSVNVRNRDDVGTKAKGQMISLDEIEQKLLALKTSRSLANKI